MLKFNERAANTVQNPESPDKVLFLNPDGVLQLKDSAGTLTNLVAESATGQSTARPFKVYKALLTQTGTSAPVATVLENTLGGTVIWTRVDVGLYKSVLVGAFPQNKTIIQSSSSILSHYVNAVWNDEEPSDSIFVGTWANLEAFDEDIKSDNILNFSSIVIEVYP